MIVDAQTQRDLEIFRARDGGPPVMTALDRTRTRPGHRALNEALTTPQTDPAAIRGRQAAIDYLRECEIDFAIRPSSVEAVQAYLDSAYATVSHRGAIRQTVDSTWIALRYHDLLKHARGGIQALGRLLGETDRLLRRIDPPGAPGPLRELCDGIDHVTARVRARGIDRGGSYLRILAFDRELRTGLREELLGLLRALGELDMLCSTAELLDEGYTLPEIVDAPGAHVEAEGLWHPYLEKGVRNPIALHRGETLVFLTGPNMAGKTTYLRSVALCVYLAQCGFPVPARRLAFAPLDRLFTGLSPQDNLRTGISYFLAEVRRVKQVLEAVAEGRRTLAIFDEVFRGTNVADALDASRAVILGCARAGHSSFIFASHLSELAEELEEIDAVTLCHFDGRLGEAELRFDYRLRPGVSRKRFGMELLRREGLSELLEALPAG